MGEHGDHSDPVAQWPDTRLARYRVRRSRVRVYDADDTGNWDALWMAPNMAPDPSQPSHRTDASEPVWNSVASAVESVGGGAAVSLGHPADERRITRA